jgi:hypothetical protein
LQENTIAQHLADLAGAHKWGYIGLKGKQNRSPYEKSRLAAWSPASMITAGTAITLRAIAALTGAVALATAGTLCRPTLIAPPYR